MDKIKINLLPPEIKEKEKKDVRQSLINKISIALLGVLILFTSGILAVVIYQGSTINLLNADIEKEKSRIQSQKDKETIVFLLKNRIDTINQFTNKRYKQGEIYDLITGLFPQDVALRTILVDKTTKVAVLGNTESPLALQTLFDNLTDPKTNEGKIETVTVENLSNNQSGKINFDLSINLGKGVL